MKRPADDVPACVRLPNRIELHFIEKGRGQPVLLLHGGMGDCRLWSSQMTALAQRFRVIAYSRRFSSPNRNPALQAGYSIDIDVEDLMAFERMLQIGPAHLVGTSYGALVALAYALQHRGKVQSLVLAEPPLHRWACRTPAGTSLYAAFMQGVWLPAAEAFDRREERRALKLLADGIWGRPIFDSLPPQRLAAALRNVGSMKALTQSLDPFPDLPRAAVAGIAIPTLLVNGEHASALHMRVIEELAGVLPRSERAVIRGAGHGSPLENPDGFNDAVLGFLAGQVPCSDE